MKRLWRWFWTGDAHAHHWETVSENDVYDRDDSKRRLGVKYVMRCQHCGNMKLFRTYREP
jgi:hypothetical protein